MPVGKPEFAINLEPRVPVILLLDRSGSMGGKPIQELNQGLIIFKEEVEKDSLAALRVEVAIITFGPVQMTQDFVTVDQFVPPSLQADDLTPMGEAINYAIDILEDRKQDYKNNGIQYFRPWIFLITDGAPSDSNWPDAAQRVKKAYSDGKLLFFAVGVQGADMGILSQIAPADCPPMLLNGLDFKSMFLWLSQSMKQVSNSKPGGAQVTLAAPGWGQIVT